MEPDNRIGEFLRARRGLVRPEHAGIPVTAPNRRRVTGLRREELAMLAGVLFHYYVRLEQGREQHPSDQVLEALARALRLDDDAAAHLHELARPAPRRRSRRARPERVRPGLLQMMRAWPHSPAFVTGRRMDVLAANRLASALNPGCAAGGNLARSIFLDEAAARELCRNFEDVAAETVASLRASAGLDLDDPQLVDLVGELSLKSDLFRRLWARHDVRAKADGDKSFVHPIVGPARPAL
jgi:transcriptional regulator with XRE-family HTH domain